MHFNDAIARATNRTGWQVEQFMDRGDMIVWKTIRPANPGPQSQIKVRRQDVANTWDKWDENKQNRGLDALTNHFSRNLRESMNIISARR